VTAAGVSKTTASLVLRGANPGGIPAPTQERVRAAARQLGYVRNQAATELRSQAKSTIGFIADGVAEGPFKETGRRIPHDVAVVGFDNQC
jgi:DNA-binding LacI/PurR family transcriptional regulator